jgi:hypothetical protein
MCGLATFIRLLIFWLEKQAQRGRTVKIWSNGACIFQGACLHTSSILGSEFVGYILDLGAVMSIPFFHRAIIDSRRPFLAHRIIYPF